MTAPTLERVTSTNITGAVPKLDMAGICQYLDLMEQVRNPRVIFAIELDGNHRCIEVTDISETSDRRNWVVTYDMPLMGEDKDLTFPKPFDVQTRQKTVSKGRPGMLEVFKRLARKMDPLTNLNSVA